MAEIDRPKDGREDDATTARFNRRLVPVAPLHGAGSPIDFTTDERVEPPLRASEASDPGDPTITWPWDARTAAESDAPAAPPSPLPDASLFADDVPAPEIEAAAPAFAAPTDETTIPLEAPAATTPEPVSDAPPTRANDLATTDEPAAADDFGIVEATDARSAIDVLRDFSATPPRDIDEAFAARLDAAEAKAGVVPRFAESAPDATTSTASNEVAAFDESAPFAASAGAEAQTVLEAPAAIDAQAAKPRPAFVAEAAAIEPPAIEPPDRTAPVAVPEIDAAAADVVAAAPSEPEAFAAAEARTPVLEPSPPSLALVADALASDALVSDALVSDARPPAAQEAPVVDSAIAEPATPTADEALGETTPLEEAPAPVSAPVLAEAPQAAPPADDALSALARAAAIARVDPATHGTQFAGPSNGFKGLLEKLSHVPRPQLSVRVPMPPALAGLIEKIPPRLRPILLGVAALLVAALLFFALRPHGAPHPAERKTASGEKGEKAKEKPATEKAETAEKAKSPEKSAAAGAEKAPAATSEAAGETGEKSAGAEKAAKSEGASAGAAEKAAPVEAAAKPLSAKELKIIRAFVPATCSIHGEKLTRWNFNGGYLLCVVTHNDGPATYVLQRDAEGFTFIGGAEEAPSLEGIVALGVPEPVAKTLIGRLQR